MHILVYGTVSFVIPQGQDSGGGDIEMGFSPATFSSELGMEGFSEKEEDLKVFRQWGSKTPGQPQNFETPGVEATIGPLGQRITNAVGLALAEKHLATRFNKPDMEIVDHYTNGCELCGNSLATIYKVNVYILMD